ncbi:hypothetical protein [Dyella sp. ASV21]|nr:hypothetical protein [Dyella sp. ASV21]
MVKPNYSYEKRQRELAKKKQQDEKQAKKKTSREGAPSGGTGHGPSTGQS